MALPIEGERMARVFAETERGFNDSGKQNECPHCGRRVYRDNLICAYCRGIGQIAVAYKNRTNDNPDIDPKQPSPGMPGSAEKVRILAVRYESGMPLWNPADATHENGSDMRRELFGDTLPIVPAASLDGIDPAW